MAVKLPNLHEPVVAAPWTIEGLKWAQELVRAVNGLQTAEVVVTLADLGVSDWAQTLLDDTSAKQARKTLGVIIGEDVQAWNADLDTLSGVGITAAGTALLDDADAAAQRDTLELTDAATMAFEEGTGTVTVRDESGNTSATSGTWHYQRRGQWVEAAFRGLSNIDTTGLTGTDALQIDLPLPFARVLGGSAVTDTGEPVPYAATANGSAFRFRSGGSDLLVSDFTDDTADILSCVIHYNEISAALTADTTAVTADSTVYTADMA